MQLGSQDATLNRENIQHVTRESLARRTSKGVKDTTRLPSSTLDHSYRSFHSLNIEISTCQDITENKLPMTMNEVEGSRFP
mmetsp:Transcript_17321/g.23323  ORF Transcript_17321/g.23323 Transcript_17321/m.23323 type:complete len:81 (+) Transcript_17321:434-676(+)